MLDMSTTIHEAKCCSQSRRTSRHVMSASPPTTVDNNINSGVYGSWLTVALT